MKTRKQKMIILAAVLSVFALALAACSPAAPAAQTAQPQVQNNVQTNTQNNGSAAVLSTPVTDVTTVDEVGSTVVDAAGLQSSLMGSGELSDDEISGLLFMREEEKLAHDVYVTLYEFWGVSIFQNIANSEQSHTDAVKTVLDAYGLEDPAAGNAVGVFVNQDLQALYNDLVAQGSQSLGDALKVGAAIEEIDILDLENQLASIQNADVRTVYENLMKGSRNHLRSFASTLYQQTGETYVPQYLSADVYQSIVDSAVESGGYGNGNGNGNGNRP